MKTLIARLQKDISKLQATIHKEGNDLLTRVKKVDLKKDLEKTQKELKKVINAKLKKIEPTYNSFMTELFKNAKKAGIDLGKLEKGLMGAKKARGGAKKKSKTQAKAATPKASRGRKKKVSSEPTPPAST